MSNKNEIISKVYHDLSGYGSMNETAKDAKAIDNTITFKDVKEWFAKKCENQECNEGFQLFRSQWCIPRVSTRLVIH